MAKWNEPRGKDPSFLDKASEVTTRDPKLPEGLFVVAVVDELLALAVPLWQAFEATGNTMNETGGGRFYRANNLFGWKITKTGAVAYERANGRKPRWWAAPGNKARGATLEDYKGGDPPWTYYWGYGSFGEGLAKWVRAFVPKPKPADTRAALERDREKTGNYRLTGFLFWRNDPEWFVALCDAGYKGQNTDANPQPSYRAHLSHVARARRLYAQVKLAAWAKTQGIAPAEVSAADGDWGRKSGTICVRYQRAHGLPESGEPDDATLTSLAAGAP